MGGLAVHPRRSGMKGSRELVGKGLTVVGVQGKNPLSAQSHSRPVVQWNRLVNFVKDPFDVPLNSFTHHDERIVMPSIEIRPVIMGCSKKGVSFGVAVDGGKSALPKGLLFGKGQR